MLRARFRIDYLFLASIILLLAACRGQTAPQGPEIALNFGIEPPSIDPAITTDPPSIQVDNLLFINLVSLHEEDGIAEPWLATGWRVSQDGLTWEFALREDATWATFNTTTNRAEKMRAITADDVVYSVRRIFDPRARSPYAPRFAPLLRNAGPFNSADPRTAPADLERMAGLLGVRAMDSHTVQFLLSRPMSSFPSLVAAWLGRLQPREPIAESGINWTDPGVIWSSGPYLLEDWEHNQYILLRKNPFYYDAANVQIERIRFKMLPDVASALDAYVRGELDTTDPWDSIEGEQLARVNEDQTLVRDKHEMPGLCTQYIGFDTSRPPFDDVLVRRAFALGLNRDDIVTQIFKTGQAARWFTPPGLVASPDISATIGLTYNPPQAKQTLDASGYGTGRKKLPDLVIGINSSDTFHDMSALASAGWKASLGALVRIESLDWSLYLEKLQKDPPPLFRMGFCAVYPDASNFLYDGFHSGSDYNATRWSSPQYDRLLEQAARENDVTQRRLIYQAAEKMLVEDQAVIIPILWTTRASLTNPYIQRTYSLLEGYDHVERWRVNR